MVHIHAMSTEELKIRVNENIQTQKERENVKILYEKYGKFISSG